MIHRRPIRRTRKGDFVIAISAEERDVLRELPGQLRELLGTDDPGLRRLFPPAYPDDDALEAEYQQLMSKELLESHAAALDAMAATIDSERLDEEQLLAWLGALNQLRLVLGTRLEISEDHDPAHLDPSDPSGPAFALYHYLTYLQDAAVTALSG